MRVQCAECGCWVVRRVRVEVCATPDCCCAPLPVRTAESPNPSHEAD